MKIILSTFGLCVAFWTLSASAGPFDQHDAARSRRGATPTIELENHDLARTVRGTLPSVVRNDRPAYDQARPFRGTVASLVQNDRPGHDEPNGWGSDRAGSQPLLDSPRRLNVVAGIPEPSAVTLFAIGVLVALQAIPRRKVQF